MDHPPGRADRVGRVGGYLLARTVRSTVMGSSAEVFTVTRRSFPVLLREKGELKAEKSVDVKCEVEGRSTIIWLIEEGTEVKKDDLLVKLASDEIDDRVRSEAINFANAKAASEAAEKGHEILLDQHASDLRKAELALEMAEIEKEKYIKGDHEQTMLDIDLEIKRAAKVLKRAESDLEDSDILLANKFISRSDYLNDEMALLEAQIAVQKAKLRKEIEEQYNHPKMVQQTESDVAEAQKEVERVKKSNAAEAAKSAANLAAKRAEYALIEERLNKFREQQSKCEIRAPQAGLAVYDTGESRWNRREIAEGSEVYERQTIIKLPDPTVMVVTVRIHEAKTDRIAMGQEARVEVEGLPGEVFTGKVTKIAALADSQNAWLNPDLKEYETEITLDQTDTRLKPGVTARADIVVRQVENALAVPVQAVFSKTGHNFVFRGEPDSAEPVEIAPGISSDEYVEVLNGLSEDDQVLLTVSDDMRRQLPELEPIEPKQNGSKPQAGQQPQTTGKGPGQGQQPRQGQGQRPGRGPRG